MQDKNSRPFFRFPQSVPSLLFGSLLVACTSPQSKFGDLPMEFTEATTPTVETPFYNWPQPPRRVESELRKLGSMGQAVPVKWRRTEKGASGPRRYLVDFPTIQEQVRFKWASVPRSLDGLNNSPRREVAAYELQKLFLDPEDYVVPTTHVLCLTQLPDEPIWTGANCSLGVSALWLQNVKPPAVLYDVSRFVSEPVYAHYMSNLNLFTYLIAHGDGNQNNFLVSDNDRRRQVFSIDNDVSLGHIPNVFVLNWDVIRVPALRKDSIDRLRRLERDDLDFLGVVDELRLDDQGVFVHVTPGERLNPDREALERDNTLQFGPKTAEIDGVWSRIQRVIADLDAGKIEVF